MWIPVAIVLGWVLLRRRAGLPLLPELFTHPFAHGGILVNTQKGAVVVPADTPVMHPADAVDQGHVTPHALMTAATTMLAQASLAPPLALGGGPPPIDPTTGGYVESPYGVHGARPV